MTSLGTLDHNASRLITEGFRVDAERPSFDDYEAPLDLGRPIDLDGVRLLIDETMRRFRTDQTTAADVWLAPRLHHALRLTPREAANRNLWRWIGVVFAADYVRWRFGSPDATSENPKGAATKERFDGPDYKHALGRLWWMAELFRDGPDYRPVEGALKNQDIPNNLFRLDVAHHRPAAQAALKVLDGRTGREANALAKAVNAAATTLLIDAIAPDTSPLDPESLSGWLEDSDVDPGAHLDTLPSGPPDPPVDQTSIDVMAELLEQLLSEAPVRGQTDESNDEDPGDATS